MSWRIGPVVCALLARMRQLLGANEYVFRARRGSRKTSAARRRHRELVSVIEALPEIHRASRRPRGRHSTRSVGETTGRIMRRLTAIISHVGLSAGKWCVNATSSCIHFSPGQSARKWGCEAWDWMRQDALATRRRLSAMLPAVSAWRPGKLQLEWRELITKPVVIAAAAVFVLVCGSLLLIEGRLVYAAVYGGQEIGVVASRQVGEALGAQVQQDLERQLGQTVFLPAPLTYIACREPYSSLSPPGELTESIRSLPWMTDDGPVLVNQEPALAGADVGVVSEASGQPEPRPAAQGMPRQLAYGSASRGSGSDTLVFQRELRDQEEEAKIAAENGPVKSVRGIAQIAHPVAVGSAGIDSMISYAESYIGTPYVWGGTTARPGFDCSGFAQHVFGHLGIKLERTSQEQYLEGAPIPGNNLEPGDLVFFSTYTYGASHVGIYIGSGLMVDSEVSGVIIDNITNRYWASRYLGARRIAQI